MAPLSEQDAPAEPQLIAVLSLSSARSARLVGWLTRRPPLRIYFDARCRFWVTGAAVLAAFLSLIGVGAAMGNGLPSDVGLPLMLVIPALADYLPGRLDARARAYVRIVQDEAALRQMQRFVAFHQCIQGADDHATPELARAADLSRHWLWGVAGLLVHGPSHERLLVSERLFAGLARQAAATRAAKDEREYIVARAPGVDGDTGGGFDESIETTPEAELVPDALVQEAADALHQAETAYRAATARIRQLDRAVGPQQTRLVHQQSVEPKATPTP